MTRDEAMTLLTRLHLIHTGMTGAGVELLIQIVQAAATAEREACKALHEHDDVLAPVGHSAWGESYQQGWTDGTAAYLTAIRARGEV